MNKSIIEAIKSVRAGNEGMIQMKEMQLEKELEIMAEQQKKVNLLYTEIEAYEDDNIEYGLFLMAHDKEEK